MDPLRTSEGVFPWICGKGFDLGSSCTQRSLIDVLNIFLLLIYCSALVVGFIRRQYDRRVRNWDWVLVGVSICCTATSIAYFIAAVCFFITGDHGFNRRDGAVDCVRGLIWVALAVSLIIHPTKWAGVVILVWWVSFSFLISVFNVKIMISGYKIQILEILAWFVNLLLLFSAFILVRRSRVCQNNPMKSLSDHLLIKTAESKSGLGNGNFFSRLTFSWLNPLMRLGYSKPLNFADIPPLDSEDGAFLAHQAFAHAWDREDKSKTKKLVLLALSKCYLREMILIGFYALVRTASTVASPPLLYALVRCFDRKDRDVNLVISLVVCLIVAKTLESLCQRHWYFDSRRYGMRMRSALIAAIFQKQLQLSSQGRQRHSAGEIVNYIAVDAYRFGEFPWWFHLAWSLPLQLLLSIGLLFWAVGLGALPGLVPLIVCGVLNVPFGKMLQWYQSEFMVAQDERLRSTSEVLNNIKIIKLQSWEDYFRTMIQSLREMEFKWLTEIQVKKAYGTALYWMSPTIVSAVIFAGAAVTKSARLDAASIFTVLATLRILSEPVRMLPEVLSVMIQFKVSLDRLDVFLLEDEINEEDVKRRSLGDSHFSVRILEGNFSWDPFAVSPTLMSINVDWFRGQKIAVCGPVGAGKSSLLCAILGEIPKISGSVEVFGSVAYVSQTSWIQSGTIRDNILYGKPMNTANYEKVIRSCALDKDIDEFDHGDLTEIGQRGINMSGGQKQRIQLARAVYSDADIYLLDDPFSAVDAHTAAILFHDCVMAALVKKTVILVTHQVEFLAGTDKILVMESGHVTQSGTYDELLKSGTAFEQLVNAHRSAKTIFDSVDHEVRGQAMRSVEDQLEISGLPPGKQHSEGEISVKGMSAIQLTEDEEKEIGNSGWKPYKDYIDVSNGYLLLALVILTQSAFAILQILSSYWLAIAVQMQHTSEGILIGVYTIISVLSCLFAFLRSLFSAHLGLKASKAFFSGLMDSVFKAPMLFFDSTPVGRILTRASSDLNILDFDIQYSTTFALAGLIELVSTILIMASVTWQVLIVAVPALLIVVYIQRYYQASARELVRINGTTKAPVTNHAAETLLGVVTIRAFAVMERFIHSNLQLIDADATLFFYTIAAMEWVLIRVEALQNLIILTSTLSLALIPQGSISPGFVGLCLSYSISLTSTQAFLTRWYSSSENGIISVERIKQYMHIPSEPPAIISEKRPQHLWPQEGRIDLQDLKIRYRPNAPFVLKGITCTFAAGKKVGVVGRTGSGKTTLISALFRLVDPTAGTILIDNLDICSIGLKDLRMKLSIIPQEPTLFRGSVRSNLDPLSQYTDHEIWEALGKCQMKDTVSSLPALLDSPVTDDGGNWSTGQRQLFCLGRVLLRKNRILVLDEATASIDSATDAILQRIIRQEFSACTVITVAHRVPTVTDSDMVMVLSYGKMLEYDKPSKLMENNESFFSKLVVEYWSNCKISK